MSLPVARLRWLRLYFVLASTLHTYRRRTLYLKLFSQPLKNLGKKLMLSGRNNNYRAFSHDVTAAMLVLQNKEMAAMMVYQTNPAGIELYFYANTFFCFINPIWLLVT